MSDDEAHLYYAQEGKVWKRPIKTDNGDGSCAILIGFPVCTMHEAVGVEAAEAVAALMNAGHAATTAGDVTGE